MLTDRAACQQPCCSRPARQVILGTQCALQQDLPLRVSTTLAVLIRVVLAAAESSPVPELRWRRLWLEVQCPQCLLTRALSASSYGANTPVPACRQPLPAWSCKPGTSYAACHVPFLFFCSVGEPWRCLLVLYIARLINDRKEESCAGARCGN